MLSKLARIACLHVALIGYCVAAHADTKDLRPPGPTELYGPITSDRTVTAAAPGPDYDVLGDVTVQPGVTLTIERGVTLHFRANSDLMAGGSDRERTELVVRGRLIVPAGATPVQLISSDDASTAFGGPGTWAGVTIDSGGVLLMSDAVIRGARNGILAHAGSSIDLRHLQIANAALAGVVTESGAMGTIRSTYVFSDNRNQCGCPQDFTDTGFILTHGISTAPDDSLSPEPSIIRGCNVGVQLSSNATVRNVMCAFNSVGIQVKCCDGSDNAAIDYCTTYGNTSPLYYWLYRGPTAASAVLVNQYAVCRITNSVISGTVGWGVYCQDQATASLAYSDVWGCASTGGNFTGDISFYSRNASFDPFFISAADYHLRPESFFNSFGVSDGQIGAYGPGSPGATPVLGATAISAAVEGGSVRIVWAAEGSEGDRAIVFRRTGTGDWQPQGVAFATGDRHVEFDDANIPPGARYGYALGVRNALGIAIDGAVWVDVPGPVALAITLIAPNPASESAQVKLALSTAQPATLEVLDVTGRVLSRQTVSSGPGLLDVALVDMRRLNPGLFFLRLTQGRYSTAARFAVAR